MFSDYPLYCKSDGLPPHGTWRQRMGNANRITRRILKRTWLDKPIIHQPRFFCQNSGGCGSSYIVQLLTDNGIERCFHEKTPDLNELGIRHFESPITRRRAVRLLRYSRHDVYFEANNRLFSFSRELKDAFPNAQFIHLHRHAADAVCSSMSKPDVERYLANNVRTQGQLAGEISEEPFVRFCHYWTNINRRILDDLESIQTGHLTLPFTDLVAGKVDRLGEFMGRKFEQRNRSAVNTGQVRPAGRFPKYADWSKDQQNVFQQICGATLERLGYSVVPESKPAS